MKKTLILFIGVLAAHVAVSTVQGAFIIEPRTPGKAFANFSNLDGTNSNTAVDSSAVGLTALNGSIFGGNGAADEYIFRYDLGSNPDNTVLAPGLDLGNGDLASGLVGGSSGTYNVFATWPSTFNVSGGGSDFWLSAVGSNTRLIEVLDFNQNDTSNGAGDNLGANKWFLLGSADLTSGVSYELHVRANSATFVSQRLDGVMFEVVPEPSTVALGLIGGAGLMVGYFRRRAKK